LTPKVNSRKFTSNNALQVFDSFSCYVQRVRDTEFRLDQKK
jgi:hypothetical protein